ncbi:class D sortase [Rossellomorea marisflavi]|uniref:class D sortase n=1 Tax=Rossellomorea marisflavi TaxID=189381 RepID=UPI0034594099
MKKVIGILLILMSLPLLFHSQIKDGVYKGFNEKLLVAASEGKGEVKKTMFEKLYLSDSADVETSDIKAVLRIPSIELEEPIFQGASESHLKNGVATIEEDTPFSGTNISIAGHKMNAYGVLFNRLHELTKGDMMALDVNGKTTTYKVTEQRMVSPDDLSVLEDTEDQTITLITCETYNWTTNEFEERLVVRGEKIEKRE